MTLRKLRSTSQPRLMIIPMIDIILFLLVFFMMSTLYMVDQNLLPVNLPTAQSATPAKNELVPITLTADKKILFNNDAISRGQLAARAQAAVAANSDASFVIRADQNLAYGEVIAVLDELKLAGVSKVAVATQGN